MTLAHSARTETRRKMLEWGVLPATMSYSTVQRNTCTLSVWSSSDLTSVLSRGAVLNAVLKMSPLNVCFRPALVALARRLLVVSMKDG